MSRIKIGRQTKKYSQKHSKSGAVLIVVDTNETEKNYFLGLKNKNPKITVVIRKSKKSEKIVDFALEYREKNERFYSEVWLVFDRDEIVKFDSIIKEAKSQSLHAGWSNPCFEIWLFAHFGSMPNFDNSQQCVRRFGEVFKKHCGREYRKNDEAIYSTLEEKGDVDVALELAEQKYKEAVRTAQSELPSKLNPACTVYELVKRLLQ